MCPELAVEYCRWIDPIFGRQANQLVYAVATDSGTLKVKPSLETDIVNKILAMKKKPGLKLSPLLRDLLEHRSVQDIKSEILPQLIKSIAGVGDDLKLDLLDRLEIQVREFGNEKHKSKKKKDDNYVDFLWHTQRLLT